MTDDLIYIIELSVLNIVFQLLILGNLHTTALSSLIHFH